MLNVYYQKIFSKERKKKYFGPERRYEQLFTGSLAKRLVKISDFRSSIESIETDRSDFVYFSLLKQMGLFVFLLSFFVCFSLALEPPKAPIYPDLYTISFNMIPGGFVLEAYDFTSKSQLFWFSVEKEVKELNRFDLGKSLKTALNATCSVKAIGNQMQPPNFLESFSFVGNETCTSPK